MFYAKTTVPYVALTGEESFLGLFKMFILYEIMSRLFLHQNHGWSNGPSSVFRGCDPCLKKFKTINVACNHQHFQGPKDTILKFPALVVPIVIAWVI